MTHTPATPTPRRDTPTEGERKLSALIRKGAAMVDGRQWFEDDYIGYNEDGQLCLCAIGAAYYALTGNLPVSGFHEDCDVGSVMREYASASSVSIIDVISLNDDHHLTFEEIAEFLEAYEQ